MRTFHVTWFTFLACSFGWFGLAPLMPTIREDLGLTKSQVGNTIIAAVSATIMEITFDNMASLHSVDNFKVD
jgi:MFS transporter, NNP family, nitrate/nitrite transporter